MGRFILALATLVALAVMAGCSPSGGGSAPREIKAIETSIYRVGGCTIYYARHGSKSIYASPNCGIAIR